MFAGSGDEDIRVSLFAEDGMTPVFRAVADSAAVFTGSLERSMSGLARLGPAAAPVLLIAGAFVAAGSAAVGVQQNVANLNAALNATPTQLKAIRDAGLQLAQQTQFTDAQIIESQRQLAKAHADTLAIIKETRDVTNLAGATQSTPVAAATLLTTAQKAFGLGTNDSAKQSDILATSIDSSVGSANDLAIALKQVGPTARAAGLDLATFATATADLQNQGLRGSAGTAMQTFLQRIMRETPQAKAAIKDLGLEFYNSDQTLKPYADILDEIRIKTAGVSEETRNADLTAIFGQRGIKIADIAAESGSAGYADTKQHQDSLGTAAEINAKKLDTFSGSASRLASSVNTLGVQMGTVLLPGMKAAGDLGISVANMFSSLNNNVAILPQLLVGAGAVFGLSKVNNIFDARKQSNAQPGIDAASKQAAIDANNAEARVKAEFSADSQIFAARAELDQKIIALDKATYDNWIKLEMDGAKSYEEATAKQLASLQSITAKTLSSIAEIDAAQQASAQANIDRTILQGQKQQEILAVGQRAESQKASLPSSVVGDVKRQAIDTAALDEKNAIELKYAGMENDIAARAYYVRRDLAIKNGEEQIQAVEREYQGRLTAIQAGIDEGLIVEEEGYAKSLAAATAAAAKKDAIARASGANALGSGFGPGGAAVGGADIYEGSIGNGPIPIPVKGQVVAKEVATEAGLKARVGGALSTFGAAAGEFVMPALIAITIKQLIVDPSVRPLVDHFLKTDPLDTQTKPIVMEISDMVSLHADPAAIKVDADLALKQLQENIDEAAKQKAAQHSGVGGFLKDRIGGNVGVDYQYDKTISDAQAGQQQIRDMVASVDPIKKNADAVNYLADAYGDLEAKVSTHTITMDVAIARGQVLALQQLQLGVSADKVASSYQAYTKSISDNAKAEAEANQQAAADFATNLDEMRKNSALGLGADANAVASFGTHLTGTAATKLEIQQAKKDASELASAWQKAGAAINGVDATKGISGLAADATNLERAQQALGALGQRDSKLDVLTALATSFKQITDEEDAANASLNGYMLTLNHTNDAISQIGSLQKGFTDALNAAETRVAQGIGTDKDAQLIREAPSILGSLNTQKEKLSQNTDDDWLGIAANLPKWDQLDKDARSIVQSVGGGTQAYLDIKSNAQALKDEIDRIVNGPYDMTVNVDLKSNGQLIDAAAKIAGMPTWLLQALGLGANAALPGSGVGALGYRLPDSGSTSSAPWIPTNAYQPPPGGGTSSTATPRGDASALAPLTAIIEQAAKDNKVDPVLLGDIIMHESGGVIGKVQPNGQGRGLMQVDGGYHAEAYDPRMTGTTMDDAAFQINAGAKILADMITQYGPDQGVQNYAGPAYGATGKDGGAPAGTRLPDELAQYYSPAVSQVIGTGYGAAIDTSRFEGLPGDPSQDNGMSQKMVDAAKSHLGDARDAVGKAWDGWCEQFVGDVEQQAGLVPYRAANPEQHLQDIENGVKGAGTIIDPSQRRPGDQAIIVTEQNPMLNGHLYDPSSVGHTGVVAEDTSKFYDTGKGGIHLDTLPSNTIFVRPDGVVANGPVPGSKAVGGAAGKTYDGSAGGESGLPKPIYRDVSLDADRINQLNQRSDPDTIIAVQKFDQIATPILQKIQAMGMNGGAGPIDQFQAADAQQRGAQWGLKEDAAVQQYLLDVKNKTGDIHADIDQIVKGGGQMGEAFAAAAVNAGQIAAATEKQKADQQAVTAATQDWQRVQAGWQVADKGTQESRAAADLATQVAATKVSRKATTDEWRVADDRQKAQDGWKLRKDNLANLTQLENDAWQIKQETYSDELRMIQQNGTVAQRALEDQGLAIDRNHKAQIAGSTAYEQVLLAQSKASLAFGTPGGSAAAVQLASMKAGDQRSNDDYAKVKANLQDAITAQARLASDTAFNIQTQETLDQRAHDKTIRGYEDSLKAEQAVEDAKQQGWATDDKNLQRNQTLAQWKAEDERAQTTATRLAIDKQTAEERATATASHQQTMDNLNAEATKDGEYLKGLQNTGTALDGIIANWQTLLPLVGQTGNSVLTWLTSIADQAGQPLNVDSALFQQQGAGLTTKAGVPYSQFPQPGAGQGYASGTDSATAGYHAVAEHGPELLFKGGERVLNSVDTTAFLNRLLAPTPISAAVSWRSSPTVNLTIAGNSSLDEAGIANIRAFVKTEIAASEARQNPQAQARSTGAMR